MGLLHMYDYLSVPVKASLSALHASGSEMSLRPAQDLCTTDSKLGVKTL